MVDLPVNLPDEHVGQVVQQQVGHPATPPAKILFFYFKTSLCLRGLSLYPAVFYIIAR